MFFRRNLLLRISSGSRRLAVEATKTSRSLPLATNVRFSFATCTYATSRVLPLFTISMSRKHCDHQHYITYLPNYSLSVMLLPSTLTCRRGIRPWPYTSCRLLRKSTTNNWTLRRTNGFPMPLRCHLVRLLLTQDWLTRHRNVLSLYSDVIILPQSVAIALWQPSVAEDVYAGCWRLLALMTSRAGDGSSLICQ